MSLLTPNPDRGSITISIAAGDVTGDVLWITRQDVNGRQTVRTIEAAPGPAPVVVEDYEHALTGTIYYTAHTASGDVPLGSVAAGQVDWSGAWLTVPVRPALSTRVDLITDYHANLTSQTTVHSIIGRPGPLATIGPLETRRGEITYWCADYAAVRDVRAMYAHGLVVMLRQSHEGLDMFHVVDEDELTEQHHELRQGFPVRWSLTVPFVEVDRPTGTTQGTLGWSFDDVAQLSSFDLLTEAYATFYDLETGPTA